MNSVYLFFFVDRIKEESEEKLNVATPVSSEPVCTSDALETVPEILDPQILKRALHNERVVYFLSKLFQFCSC
jgi:hypothetical protein